MIKFVLKYNYLAYPAALRSSLSCFFFLFGILFAEEPWGIDADMAYPCTQVTSTERQDSTLVKTSRSVIRFHQEVISQCDGPRSHFRPTSSQYMLDAIQKYGFIQGYSMGCDRLMRENSEDWVYRTMLDETGTTVKWDPVP